MADLEHFDLLSNRVHEPKHISNSLSSESGKVITPSSTTDGVSELRYLDPIDVGLEPTYGEMYLVNNQTAMSLTAAVDPDLYTASDFTQIEQSDATFIEGFNNNGVVKNQTTNELYVPINGIYTVTAWMDLEKVDAQSGEVGFRFTKNGVVSDAVPTGRVSLVGGLSGDKHNITGHGFAELAEGDLIGISIAVTASGDYVPLEGVISLNIVRRT